jgi:hypothetical protein
VRLTGYLLAVGLPPLVVEAVIGCWVEARRGGRDAREDADVVATVRDVCQRYAVPPPPPVEAADEETAVAALAALDARTRCLVADLGSPQRRLAGLVRALERGVGVQVLLGWLLVVHEEAPAPGDAARAELARAQWIVGRRSAGGGG